MSGMTARAARFAALRRQLLLGAGAALAGSRLLAQERWPARPVRIIVAFPAGQASDIYARVFAERLARNWGQPVTVENRPGGSGPVAINPSVFSKLPYDSRRDWPHACTTNRATSTRQPT